MVLILTTILAARKHRHHNRRKEEEEEQARLAATYDAAPALANLDLKQQALATETNTDTNADVKPARGCCSGCKPRYQQQQWRERRRRCCQKSSRPRVLLQEVRVETKTVNVGAAVPYHPAERHVFVDKPSASGQPRSIDTKGRFATASSGEKEDLPTYDDEDEVDDAYGRVEGHGLLADVEGGLPPYALKG